MGHDVGESLVVVAFNPNDFDVSFAIREFSDIGEEFPMIAVEPREVEVREDVAQENQTAEAARSQQLQGISSTADFRPEMDI